MSTLARSSTAIIITALGFARLLRQTKPADADARPDVQP